MLDFLSLTAVHLECQILKIHRIEGALHADVHPADPAVRDREDLNFVKIAELVEVRDTLLIATKAIEPLGQDNINGALFDRSAQRHIAWPQIRRTGNAVILWSID